MHSYKNNLKSIRKRPQFTLSFSKEQYLSNYSQLTDKYLKRYFMNQTKLCQLLQNGFITPEGNLLPKTQLYKSQKKINHPFQSRPSLNKTNKIQPNNYANTLPTPSLNNNTLASSMSNNDWTNSMNKNKKNLKQLIRQNLQDEDMSPHKIFARIQNDQNKQNLDINCNIFKEVLKQKMKTLKIVKFLKRRRT